MHYYTATDEGSWCKGYNSTTALTICKDYKGPFSYHHMFQIFFSFYTVPRTDYCILYLFCVLKINVTLF